MAPPGLAMVSVSPRGREVIEKATMPRFYLDLAKALNAADLGQTPWTPALSAIYGLREGLRLILEHGVEQVHAAHAHYGDLTRRLVTEAGLDLFADPRHASATGARVRQRPVPLRVAKAACASGARRDPQARVFAPRRGPAQAVPAGISAVEALDPGGLRICAVERA